MPITADLLFFITEMIGTVAFAVSGAFVFGDHLAFTAGFDTSMITALIVGKLTAGVLSILAALYLCKEK